MIHQTHFFVFLQRSKPLFVPYLLMDVFFLIASILCGILGILLNHMIALGFIFFFIKIYLAVSVYILFKDEMFRVSSQLPDEDFMPRDMTKESEVLTEISKTEGKRAPLAEAL